MTVYTQVHVCKYTLFSWQTNPAIAGVKLYSVEEKIEIAIFKHVQCNTIHYNNIVLGLVSGENEGIYLFLQHSRIQKLKVFLNSQSIFAHFHFFVAFAQKILCMSRTSLRTRAQILDIFQHFKRTLSDVYCCAGSRVATLSKSKSKLKFYCQVYDEFNIPLIK